jgi:membrane protein implicated in regulation of membrane protease activity
MYASSDDPKVIARNFINSAIGSYSNGDNYAAQVYLARALITDTTLQFDPETRELAAKYTGLNADAAIKQLTTPAGSKGGRSGGVLVDGATEPGAGGDHWMTVLLELVVLIVAGIFIYVLLISLARPFASDITSQVGGSARSARTQAELLRVLSSNQPTALIQGAVSYSLGIAVGVIAWNAIMYAFCIAALGGTGGILSHMSAAFRVQIATILITAVSLVLFVLSFRSPIGTRDTLQQLSAAISIVGGLGTLVALIYFISRVHDFDWVKGFVAVVLSPFIIACGLCGLIFVAGRLG